MYDISVILFKFHSDFLVRYTKALEIIKKLHKDQTQEIKSYKLKLENLQTLRDAALKVFIYVFMRYLMTINTFKIIPS